MRSSTRSAPISSLPQLVHTYIPNGALLLQHATYVQNTKELPSIVYMGWTLVVKEKPENKGKWGRQMPYDVQTIPNLPTI